MSRSTATARQLEIETSAAIAAPSATRQVERFVAKGAVYRWEERAAQLGDESAEAAREARAQVFTRSMVPQAEARGARGLVFAAAVARKAETGSVRWISWRVPGDAKAIWGLYATARFLGSADQAANDAFVLVTWGEGTVLQWVDDRDIAREAVRVALHAPPAWIGRGFRSRDVTFPVRVDVLRRTTGRNEGQMALALAPAATPRDALHTEETRSALLGMVRAWRAAHPLAEKAVAM